jgi:hypothetical protein
MNIKVEPVNKRFLSLECYHMGVVAQCTLRKYEDLTGCTAFWCTCKSTGIAIQIPSLASTGRLGWTDRVAKRPVED